MQELEKILEEIEEQIQMKKVVWESLEKPLYNEFEQSLWIAGMKNAKEIILRHMNDGWIPVEERLPDNEAKQFIQKELKGIGYLYPCLLTYKSPLTERVNVVRFYYDIHEKWFVNAGEKLCDKERCLAWKPLPAPYLPKQKH